MLSHQKRFKSKFLLLCFVQFLSLSSFILERNFINPSRRLFSTLDISTGSINNHSNDYNDNPLQEIRRIPRNHNKLESTHTLVLNADYQPLSHLPLSVWHWQDTIRAVFSGKAVVVAEYNNILIRSMSCSFKLPSVIALKHYQKKPHSVPVMTRRYVFIRDGYRCQYCQDQFPYDMLSLDHVIPRSRGGKLTWTNTVCACINCNIKKGNMMPEEIHKIGMKLKSLPYEPSTSEIQAKGRARKNLINYHPDWLGFI